MRALYMETLANFLTAVSAIIVGVAAIYGVREWKRQLVGKTDYEIARRYLKTALRLRDAISFVRNPFVSLGEMQSALKEHGMDSEEYGDKQKTNLAVYSIRWKKVRDAWTDLEAEVIEAEVSWGREAFNVQKSLDMCVRELLSSLNLYLEGHTERGSRQLIYEYGEKDEFRLKVEKSIKEIEDFLRPHLH